MITCDCCGHYVEHEEVVQRATPGTQTALNPYGEREDWCPGCSQMLEQLEAGLMKKYRAEMREAIAQARNNLMASMMKRS